MSKGLRSGTQLQTVFSGVSCAVGPEIGGGAQGTVYKATLGSALVAVKWYEPEWASSEQWAILERQIEQGAPAPAFIWPLDLVQSDDLSGFGYVMPFGETRFKSVVEWTFRTIKPQPSLQALVLAGFGIANSIFQLHMSGQTHCDISSKNTLFDPRTGEVLLVDNDSVSIDGLAPGNIGGLPTFMAPEIVRGEVYPSSDTDLHSLAVLLFHLFMVNHPLEGQKAEDITHLDPRRDLKIFGTEPVFIFDPENDSNRPMPDIHTGVIDFWPIYPGFFRDLFIRAFTDGLRDPQAGRVRTSEWCAATSRLHDSVVDCQNCKVTNFYDREAIMDHSGRPGDCWDCKQELLLPPRLHVGDHVVVLRDKAQLYRHHLNPRTNYDFSRVVGSVKRGRSGKRHWELTNRSSDVWTYSTELDAPVQVHPDQTVRLITDAHIYFGPAEGQVRF